MDLALVSGNALLISADLAGIDDRILLPSLAATMLVPASAWLLGSAFGAFSYLRRRQLDHAA